MMLKLRILDMKRFLQVLDTCPIYAAVQENLRQRFEAAGHYLPLTLRVPDPSDYRKIVNYYVGDC